MQRSSPPVPQQPPPRAGRPAPLWLDLDGTHNVRDVAGLGAGAGAVRPGVLLRGDHLEDLTPAAADHLCDVVGLRAVVDLRSTMEDPVAGTWMDGRSVDRVHLPLVDLTGSTLSAFRPTADPDMTQVYRAMLDRAGPALAEILRFATEPGRTPLLVHCAAGKDRTGITVAVLLAAAGVDEDDIVADYVVTGLRMDRIRAALRTRGYADAPVPAVAPLDDAPIRAVLTALHDAGGAAEFLRSHGATDTELEQWRRRLVEG